MEILHLEEAVSDQLREAAFWHEQSPELRAVFAQELESAIETISRAPEGYVRVSSVRNLRRYHEERFHTHILYEYLSEKDLLLIVRVYNARMNPVRFLP